MRSTVGLVKASAVLFVIGCGGGDAGPVAVPTSIAVTAGASQSSAAGVALATPPTFVVKDQSGNAMSGVSVTVTVSSGGGTLASAATASVASGTPVGVWTLGTAVGTNTLTITVSGIAPTTVTATGVPGPPAKIVATTATTLAGTVGEAVTPSPSVVVKDAFDNPVPGGILTVTVGGGGTAPATATVDASGAATVAPWTLGTIKGTNTLTIGVGTQSVAFTATAAPGPATSVSVASGDNQTALAGTQIPSLIKVSAADKFGNTVDTQAATFSVLVGGGTVFSATGTANADGTVSAPGWTLGKSAVPQQLLVTVGTKTAVVSATVQTAYVIDVRFWGSPVSVDQQAFFTGAAARIKGAITGELPTQSYAGADPSACGATGVAVLTETSNALIIYASVQTIDGPGKILASAGPCYLVSSTDKRTVIGIMQFDVADLATLAGAGSLQDVITHEMLHVVGVGSIWKSKGLLTGFNTANVAYIGAGGIAGCQAIGGTASCASSVPVENTGGPGTANGHWRESVFGNELMTGFANAGALPLSEMTIRSLGDLSYTMNPAAADPYTITIGSLRASRSSLLLGQSAEWEAPLGIAPRPLPRASHR